MHQQRKGALLLHSFHFILLPFLFVFPVNASGVANLPKSQQIDLTIKCGKCLCINSCTQQNPPPVPSPPPPVPLTEQCPPATTNQAPPPPPPRFVYFTDPLDHPTLNPPPPPRYTYAAPPGNPSNRIPPPPPPRFIYISEPTTDPYGLDIYSMAAITFPERSFFLLGVCGLLAGILFF